MKKEPPLEPAREGNEPGQEKTTNDSGRNRKGRSRKMPESEKWSRTHIANRLMVWTTALVAFATLFYAVATAFQVYLFHKNAAETARQTDKLIDASDKQAAVIREALEETKRANREAAERAERALNAAEKQASASTTQANVSERLAGQNKDLIQSARIQANTSQLSASAANRSARISEQALRAQIGIEQILTSSFEPHKPILFFIVWKNDGNSSATILSSVAKIGIFPQVPAEDACRAIPNAPMRPINVSPHNTRPQPISVGAETFKPEEIQAVKNGNAYFVICGQVVYVTVGIRDTFPLCSYSTGDLNVFLECGTKIEQE